MTYMRQEERGVMLFRFQTDEKSLYDKMKRRKNFKLVSIGQNCDLWVFVASYRSPQKAKKALGILTGRSVQKDNGDGVYFA